MVGLMVGQIERERERERERGRQHWWERVERREMFERMSGFRDEIWER